MRKIFILVGICILGLGLNAQILEPVKWDFSSERVNDSEIILKFKAKMDKGWHVYDQDIPEGGPSPTSFTFEETNGIEFIGKVTPDRKPHKEMDPSFDMELSWFSNEITFIQKIDISKSENPVIKGYVDYMACNDETCLPPSDVEFSFDFNEDKSAKADEKPEENINVSILSDGSGENGASKNSLWSLFFLAFLGGLAAILTPCVFPMIPMTVSFFLHQNKSKAAGRLNAIIYGISIILIYTVIGTIVAIAFGADFANFLSTHWFPNVLFFLIFIFFAASFFGMFEMVLPSWMVNKSSENETRGGITGSFFMALTLVLVSFSCTGPIVGAILVASAGGQVLLPIIGMLGFSLAFALPFALFAFFPSLLKNLPKSGGWLNSVKVILGFIELALGLKFLSVADQTYHWGLLDREVYLALWIVIFVLMGFYLLGKLKFAHDSPVSHISVPRLFMAISTFAFVMYLIPGMFGAPLKALSGFLPPQTSHDFDINQIVRDNAQSTGNVQPGIHNTAGEPAKYSEFLHLPHGLKGYFDLDEALVVAKEQNKPLFIDFTGHGCVNCREMEANVWSAPEVQSILRNEYIIVALYVDDKTKLPENEWIKSDYDGKMKKTLGKKNADFQIHRFNVNAQPYYVLLDHSEEILATPIAYDLDVNNFVKFLNIGIDNFKKQSGLSASK